MAKRPSFDQAKAQYVHRFTMEHAPAWSAQPVKQLDGSVKHYAPQFRTDREWYDATLFPGEPEHKAAGYDKRYCLTRGQTWPLGQWLETPFRRPV